MEQRNSFFGSESRCLPMNLYTILADLGIAYEEIDHDPVYTVEQAQSIKNRISGVGCKNLFLTDHRKTKYLLVILEESKHADLKQIAAIAQTSRLSFVSNEELYGILRLSPGSVSPFGIIYDKANRVKLLIDADLQGKRLLFHPNINTKTLAISFDDTMRFIEYTSHTYKVF